MTDAAEPYFLYTLDVGEDDFHELKRDQSLLVDFDAFPRKFIELLASCARSGEAAGTSGGNGGSGGGEPGGGDGSCDHSHEPLSAVNLTPHPTGHGAPSAGQVGAMVSAGADAPRFVARLETDNAGWSLFSVVETNPFKQLTHLALQFRPGNDATIKSYLAGRLQQVLGERQRLSVALERAESSYLEESSERSRACEQLATIRQEHEDVLRTVRSEAAAEISSRREEAAAERESAVARQEKAREEAARAMDASIDALRRRLEESEAKVGELGELKYSHEAQLRDLQARLSTGEAVHGGTTTELGERRSQVAALEATKFELEKKVHQCELRIAALDQQVVDKEEVLAKSQTMQAASDSSHRRMEEAIDLYKKNIETLNSRLNSSADEINKGNDIIAKIQAEHSNAKVGRLVRLVGWPRG